MGYMRDTETQERLEPVYLALTCSKATSNRFYDFDSNSVTARINVRTFSKCWSNVFSNNDRGLGKSFVIPETDKDFKSGFYLLWTCCKKPEEPDGGLYYLDGGEILNKTLIGLVNEEFLKKKLPNTSGDLMKQRFHFHLDK